MRYRADGVPYVIPGLVPEGLTVLVSGTEGGKTLLALDFALSVATGGMALGAIPVEQGEVLYRAVDCDQPWAQEIALMLNQDRPLPERFAWGQPGSGDLWRQEQQTLCAHRSLRLLVLDSVAPWMQPGGGGDWHAPYQDNYEVLRGLKGRADYHEVAIVATLRCEGLGDDWDAAMSAAEEAVPGITTVDTVLLLLGSGERMTLCVTGRDIPERRLPVQFRDRPCGMRLRAPE